MPTTSWASMPLINCLSVVSISFATVVWARPWCASPQPTMPSSVVTLTTTASRLTAVPMPSATRLAGGIGKETGKALTSVMRNVRRLRVDEVVRALAGQHAQQLLGGGDAHAGARLDRHAGEVRREHRVVEREQRMAGRQAVVLVDVEHGAGDAPLAQRGDQRRFLDHRAAPHVDQPGGRFHLRDQIVIKKV